MIVEAFADPKSRLGHDYKGHFDSRNFDYEVLYVHERSLKSVVLKYLIDRINGNLVKYFGCWLSKVPQDYIWFSNISCIQGVAILLPLRIKLECKAPVYLLYLYIV